MEKVRILIADDDRELASILAAYLQEQPDFEVVGWAEMDPGRSNWLCSANLM